MGQPLGAPGGDVDARLDCILTQGELGLSHFYPTALNFQTPPPCLVNPSKDYRPPVCISAIACTRVLHLRFLSRNWTVIVVEFETRAFAKSVVATSFPGLHSSLNCSFFGFHLI